MKFEWEVSDIIPGRVVGHPDRIERWMIGYRVTPGDGNEYVLVSMADGMVQAPLANTGAMAAMLNQTGDIPIEFLPASCAAARAGAKGGQARAAKLTAQRRSDIASKAGKARWQS